MDLEVLNILDTLEQMSDEELSKAKLYADLSMDSMMVMCMLRHFDVTRPIYIRKAVCDDLGTGVSLTVEKFLDVINTHRNRLQ